MSQLQYEKAGDEWKMMRMRPSYDHSLASFAVLYCTRLRVKVPLVTTKLTPIQPFSSLALLYLLVSAVHAQLTKGGAMSPGSKKQLTEAETPPSVYEWIEENAHICTVVPSSKGEKLVNFLSVEEGEKCVLCPELEPRQLPTSACAVVFRANELDVDIGCHPLPELCLLELKTRYADFYGGPREEGGESGEKGNIFQGSPFESASTTEIPPEYTADYTLATTITTSSTVEPSSTVRADAFSSPDGLPGMPINITMSGFKERSRVSVPVADKQAAKTPTGISFRKRPNPWPGSRNVSGEDVDDAKGAPPSQAGSMVTVGPPCEDLHDLCCFWATAGECDSNPFWMRVQCARTCGTCGCSVRDAIKCVSSGVACEVTRRTTPSTTTSTTTAATTTTTPSSTTSTTTPSTTTTTVASTTRRRPFGSSWGRAKPPGHRPQRPYSPGKAKLKTTTKMTSTTSTPTPPPTTSSTTTTTTTPEPTEADTEPPTTPSGPTCVDSNRLCDFWRELGECEHNPFWMRPHCQKSCDSCGENLEDVLAPVLSRPDCANLHKLCPFWAFTGECETNPRWMLTKCRASCKLC